MKMLLFIGIPILVILIILVITYFLFSRRSKKKLPTKFAEKWLEIQRLCASKETWSLAVISADKLLEQGLKKRHVKGKSMGERLVAAQRMFTNNDGVWYAHNL